MKETHETKHRIVNEQLVELDNQTNQLMAIREQLDDATCKGNVSSTGETSLEVLFVKTSIFIN